MACYITAVTLVQKSLEDSTCASVLTVIDLAFVKHWGVLLKIKEDDSDDGITKLIDANNENDILKCRMVDFLGEVKSAWKKAAGFAETKFPIESPIPYNEREMQKFLESFNGRQVRYQSIMANCQEFVRELVTHLNIGEIFQRMFFPVKRVVMSTVMWSARSASWPFLEKIRELILQKGIGALMGEAKTYASRFGGEIMKYLPALAATDTGKCLMKQTAEHGKRLILSGIGEMIEGMMNEISGNFTWYQLIQIPVEIGIMLLLECEWFKETWFKITGMEINGDRAYVTRKVVSLATAATVGGVVAGTGTWSAVVMWFVAEVVTFALRVLCGWISSFITKDGSDYFDQWIGPSKTLSLLKYMFPGFFKEIK